jgi:two-component system NtrC family sensor kinase
LRFERLKSSLIMAFLLVAMIPLSGLVYLIETNGEQLIKEKVSSHLLGLSGKTADEVSRFILERQNDIRMLSHTIHAGDIGSDATLKRLFARMKENYRVYLDFFIVDRKGKISGSKPGIRVEDLIGHKTDIRLSETGEAASDVFLLADDGSQIPVILMSIPIYSQDGRSMATLFAVVDFRNATDALNTVIEKTGEVYLVNGRGYFISSSRFGVETLKDRITNSLQKTGDRIAGIDEPIDYRGKNVLHAYQKIANFNWYVIAEQDRDEALSDLYRFRKFMILYIIATVLVVFGLAYGIATLLVNRLRENYRREKELEFQVTQKDKLAALGLLSAGLAHELNTPLADALLYTQMIQEDLEENDRALIRKRLTTIEEVIKHGSVVVKNLLAYTSHTQNGANTTNISETFERLLNLVGPHCDSKKINIVKDIEPSMPPVRAEPGIVQEILTNLVANAIDAMPQGGSLRLTARYLPVLEKVRIDIADTGQGIPSDLMGQVFDPFFTTKPPGEGIGLGLFVSHEMARRLGGTMKVISTQGEIPGQGETVFTVELPADLDGTVIGGSHAGL